MITLPGREPDLSGTLSFSCGGIGQSNRLLSQIAVPKECIPESPAWSGTPCSRPALFQGRLLWRAEWVAFRVSFELGCLIPSLSQRHSPARPGCEHPALMAYRKLSSKRGNSVVALFQSKTVESSAVWLRASLSITIRGKINLPHIRKLTGRGKKYLKCQLFI